jgi:hypothetical protein
VSTISMIAFRWSIAFTVAAIVLALWPPSRRLAS